MKCRKSAAPRTELGPGGHRCVLFVHILQIALDTHRTRAARRAATLTASFARSLTYPAAFPTTRKHCLSRHYAHHAIEAPLLHRNFRSNLLTRVTRGNFIGMTELATLCAVSCARALFIACRFLQGNAITWLADDTFWGMTKLEELCVSIFGSRARHNSSLTVICPRIASPHCRVPYFAGLSACVRCLDRAARIRSSTRQAPAIESDFHASWRAFCRHAQPRRPVRCLA